MNRVLVIGCPGAGKSTFSERLSEIAGFPLYHLDQIFWKPGWIQEERDVFEKKLEQWLEQDQWIIDGNYPRTLPRRLERADTVVFLDMPTWMCLYHVCKRIFKSYGRSRKDMSKGCPEKVDLKLFWCVMCFRRLGRPRILRVLCKINEGVNVITLRSGAELESWLQVYKASKSKGGCS